MIGACPAPQDLVLTDGNSPLDLNRRAHFPFVEITHMEIILSLSSFEHSFSLIIREGLELFPVPVRSVSGVPF